MRVIEDLINLLQTPALRLHKREVNERNPRNVDRQVQDVEMPPGVRDPHRRRIRVDKAYDIQPQPRHRETFGAGVVAEHLGGVERLARGPDEGERKQEDVDEGDAGQADGRVAGLLGTADDDDEDADAADGAGPHQHGATAVAVDEVDAEESADSHDWGLKGVHQELLLVGDDTGCLCHQGHIVTGWWEIDLPEEADAEDEEGPVAGTLAVE